MILTFRGLFLLSLALLLVACSAPSKPALRYFLPPLPDNPRIEWLGTYYSADDFPKSDAQRRMEAIVGKPPVDYLIGPSGIASDGEGKVFVADIYLGKIMVFDMKTNEVSSLTGDADGSMEPRQLAIDARKQIYVADSKLGRVRVFSREGKQLRIYGTPELLAKSLGVAVDDQRQRLYVSDGPRHRVQVFELDSGKHLFTIGTGEAGRKEGELYNPAGLAIAPDGSLYVIELLNARVSIFNPDGTFRKYFGDREDSIRGFESPRAAAFDSEGNLWLLDFRRGSLRVFDKEGTLLLVVEAPVQHSMGFANPSAIHIDANDEIYIADFMARRFSHWRYLSKPVLTRHPITEADRQRAGEEAVPPKK